MQHQNNLAVTSTSLGVGAAANPKRIRVAMVTNIPAPYRLPVYEGMAAEKDIDLKLFYCSGKEPDRAWELAEIDIPVQYLRERYITFSGRFIHINPDVWTALKAFKPDVVITTGFNPTHLIAVAYARWHGARHIAMTDGTFSSEKKLSFIHRIVRRFVYAGTQAFVGASEGSFELFSSYGIDRKRMFKSHLCANNSAFLSQSATQKRYDFIFCGRFEAVKNPLFALDVAYETANRLGRKVSLMFVGSGQMEGVMMQRALTMLDQVEVSFPGFATQAELPQRYMSARIMLFPTSWDPWGVVANEACAAGLPVLVTPDSGAAGELVQHERNGFVLPLLLERWVDASVSLLQDDTLYERMSVASRNAVADYSYSNAAMGLAQAVRFAWGRCWRQSSKNIKATNVSVFGLFRVLMVHNTYQQRGGEDSVVDAEIEMLRSRGHVVELYTRSNDEISAQSKLNLVQQTLWSKHTYEDVAAVIAKFKPDVIHVHNTFPLISPSLYWAANSARVPVVQTLHNFRLLCPQAMFLRESKVCEDCLGKVPWRGVVRGCYRGSQAQSLVLASMVTVHRVVGTWQNKVTRYIALNEFCRSKFIAGGLPENRIVVKPNFVDFSAPTEVSRHGFLFVGRLSVEKGVNVLVDAVRQIKATATVRVAGTGPEDYLLHDVVGLQSLGALSGEAVRIEMNQSVALVLPSIWYENFPRTLVEAFGCGLPVIASRIGALAELVEDGVTGLLFESGNAKDLAIKMQWAQENPAQMLQMGKNARKLYEAEYTADRNYDQLVAIYSDAIEETTR